MDMIDKIMAFEDGTLNENDTIKFFAELIETGRCWTLQGSYGRVANSLIDANIITPGGKIVGMYRGPEIPAPA